MWRTPRERQEEKSMRLPNLLNSISGLPCEDMHQKEDMERVYRRALQHALKRIKELRALTSVEENGRLRNLVKRLKRALIGLQGTLREYAKRDMGTQGLQGTQGTSFPPFDEVVYKNGCAVAVRKDGVETPLTVLQSTSLLLYLATLEVPEEFLMNVQDGRANLTPEQATIARRMGFPVIDGKMPLSKLHRKQLELIILKKGV